MASLTRARMVSVDWYLRIADSTEGFCPWSTIAAVTERAASKA